MHETESISSIFSATTYFFGLSLVFGDMISILDSHAGAAGAIIAAITYLTNCFFKIYDPVNQFYECVKKR